MQFYKLVRLTIKVNFQKKNVLAPNRNNVEIEFLRGGAYFRIWNVSCYVGCVDKKAYL